ncbi:hypothetical protein [Bacillus sp. 1P06AnD]|uniref:hypothetical protein n=1 Tax=Bacillus sp. 1P06AnD TaxID=3132208 RepID=UPI00399FFF87
MIDIIFLKQVTLLKHLRFGIDIDGTVTRPDSIIPYLNKDFNLQLTLTDITEYDLSPFVPVDSQQLADWFTKNEALIYRESPIIEGAQQVLNRWNEQAELYFISARHDYLMDITKNWFKQHKIAYHAIELIGSHDKINAIKNQELSLFFEDKHDNAVAIAEECHIPVLLFDTPYNQSSIPDSVIRVRTWRDADQWVADWLATNNDNKSKKP